MKDIYKADYIGKLKIKQYPSGFLILLGMGTPEYPISIYTEESEDDKLIKFLRKELRDRNLHPSFFGYVSLVYPANCNNHKNTKCCDRK